MATNRTFTMLKPDAVEKGHIGAILEKINASGFRIVAMKLTHMTKQDAEAFYAIHKERPFFGELVEYMSVIYKSFCIAFFVIKFLKFA